MADTYHPQQFFEVPAPQTNATSNEVPAQSIIPQINFELYSDFNFEVVKNSTQIPMHREIVVMQELYAPGLLTTWPDNLKPQDRVPQYATEVAEEVITTFPALTVAF